MGDNRNYKVSVLGVTPTATTDSSNHHDSSVLEGTISPVINTIQPSAPVVKPRTLTIADLRERSEKNQKNWREARNGPVPARIPLQHQRQRIPEVPARLRPHKKTVAFGVTTNVSQTVERPKGSEEETRPHVPLNIQQIRERRNRMPTIPLGRKTDKSAGEGKENEKPKEEESLTVQSVMAAVNALNVRMDEFEKRFGRSEKSIKGMRNEFDRLVEVVARGMPTGGTAPPSPPHRRSTSPCRRLDELENRREKKEKEHRKGGNQLRGRHEEKRGGRLDSAILSVLERQMEVNPMLKRTIDDALEEDKYQRRQMDSHSSDEVVPFGRGSNRRREDEISPPRQRRSPVRRNTSTYGGGGVRGSVTPVRHRTTERVVMERVTHYDEDDEDIESYDGRRREPYRRNENNYDRRGVGGGYRRRNESEDEVIDEEEDCIDFNSDYVSAIQSDNFDPRSMGLARRRNGPRIEELTDGNDAHNRTEEIRREVRERREARERGELF